MRKTRRSSETEMDKIRVIITNKQKEIKIPTGLRMLVRRCCNAVLRMEEFKGSAEISVTFVNNAQIKDYNKQYRDKDMVTDVLSFGMGENGVYDIDPDTGAQILGDVVIFMVIAKQMQHAVRGQVADLALEAVVEPQRLLLRLFHGNDDVAQNPVSVNI